MSVVWIPPSVIVVGTGRSGTSTVAGLLHQTFGICMGHYMREPEEKMNPRGFFEDLAAHRANRSLLHKSLIHMKKLHTQEFNLDEWKEDLCAKQANIALLENRIDIERWKVWTYYSHAKCQRWGFKDPWWLYIEHEHMKEIAPKLIIRTWRAKEEVAQSYISKVTDPNAVEEYYEMWEEREALMDIKLKNFTVLTIKFDRKFTDDEVAQMIAEGLKSVGLL